MTTKTVHITNAWHKASGGIATFYRALMNAAAEQRRRLALIVPAETDSEVEVAEGVRIYGVQSDPAPLNQAYRLLWPSAYLLPWGRVVQILQNEQPDLVEICDKYSLPFLAGLLRQGWPRTGGPRPTVIGLSCERMDDNIAAYLTASDVARRLSRVYMKWLYFPMCDHHLAVSSYIAGELEAAAKGHRVRRGVWIRPMGVDCGQFSPSRRSPEGRRRLLAEIGSPSTGRLLLYAGRLASEKNLRLLLDCMEHLLPIPDCRLIIAGDGAMREELLQEADRRVPGRVHFKGHMGDRDELADLYANCDIFVHPNPREPFGIALLEAMASGLPLLAPKCGGLTTFANEANAWLVPPVGTAFASAVSDILNNPTLKNSKSAQARLTAEAHDWPVVASSYLELYDELHLLRSGSINSPSVAPGFYSTPGDRLGRELGAATSN